MNSRKRIELIAYSAIFTALVIAFTYLSAFVNTTGGYMNFGDAPIIIASVIFGPYVGAIAGGFGSMLTDIIKGYAYYAPFTLIIKGIEGLIVGFIANGAFKAYKFFKYKNKQDILKEKTYKTLEEEQKYKKILFKKFIFKLIISFVVAFTIVVIGYFLAKITIYMSNLRPLKANHDSTNKLAIAVASAVQSIWTNMIQMSVSILISSLVIAPILKFNFITHILNK